MKTRDTAQRLKEFDVEEKRQKVADLERMIADFETMASDLALQIKTEEERAGVSDVNHFSYPPFAKAAAQRRDNLAASTEDLRAKLKDMRAELVEAEGELRKYTLMEERGQDARQLPGSRDGGSPRIVSRSF